MNPLNCMNCGTLFMRHGPLDKDRKHCNNCEKKEAKMSGAKILIEVSHAQQVQIEELWMNEGLSMSEYFMRLHEANTQKGCTVKQEEDQKKYKVKDKKH